MKTKARIKLTAKQVTAYSLADEELQELFIRLALFMNSSYRREDYSEDAIIKNLREDLRSFVGEMDLVLTKQKNNHSLKRLKSFLNFALEEINRLNAAGTNISSQTG